MSNTVRPGYNAVLDLIQEKGDAPNIRHPFRHLGNHHHVFEFQDGTPAAFIGVHTDNRPIAPGHGSLSIAVFTKTARTPTKKRKKPARKHSHILTDEEVRSLQGVSFCAVLLGTNEVSLAEVTRHINHVIVVPSGPSKKFARLVTSS